MRKIFFIAILITYFNFTYCQVFLFNETDLSKVVLSEKAEQIIEKSVKPFTDTYSVVEYKKTSIADKNNLEIKFFKDNPILLVKDLEEHKSNRTKIRYKIGNNGFLLLSIMGHDIDGVLFSENAQYAIKSLGNGYQVIYKVLSEKYNLKCGTEDIINTNGVQHSIKTNFDKVGNTIECNLRILVLYTPAARDAVANIRNLSELSVDVTNQTFVNSGINHEFELAYCGLTNYNESGDMTTDLERFFEQNDGFMDEVHNLRNLYAADCNVLLTNGESIEFAGLAKALFSDEEHMFCVSEVNFAVDDLTFPHEIGHLLGARHDVDFATTPFAEGHGFRDITNNFRTIMASNFLAVGIPRIAHWSNPNINFNGNPTGVNGVSNNAGVLNTTIIDARTFRQPMTTIVLNGDVVNNLETRDLISVNTITTSGIVSINNNSNTTYRAGNAITLNPGFTSSAGSDFVASIETIVDCPGDPSAGGIENGGVVGKVTEEINTTSGDVSSFSARCYPNPISVPYQLKL